MIQQIFGPKKYRYARQHTLHVSVLNLVSRDVDVLRHVPFVLFNLMKLVKLLDFVKKKAKIVKLVVQVKIATGLELAKLCLTLSLCSSSL